MDTRTALDHVLLIAANDHVSNEDGSYAHPREGENACTTCMALDEMNRLYESLAMPSGQEVPDSVKLEPLSFPLDISGETTLAVSWDLDEMRLAFIRNSDDLDFRVSGALDLDALVELREKMINPAIAHEESRQRAEAIEVERARIEWEARAGQRAQEKAEHERAQMFRGLSVQGTITQNMTVHGRGCASLSAARARRTLGTVISALTPDDLIRKLPTAMTGRLNLRFCAKCEPIPNARQHNFHLNGGMPMEWTDEMLQEQIANDIWEAHHAALRRYDEEGSKA